jgi:hypothetical protein
LDVKGEGDLDLLFAEFDVSYKVAELEVEELEVVEVLDTVGVGEEHLELEGAMNADGSRSGECEGRKLRFELLISFGSEIGRPAMEPLRKRLRRGCGILMEQRGRLSL